MTHVARKCARAKGARSVKAVILNSLAIGKRREGPQGPSSFWSLWASCRFIAVDLTVWADIGRTPASRFTRLVSLPKANTQPKGASLFTRQKERLPEGSLFHIAATVRQVHPGYRGLVGSYRSMSVVPSRLLRFFEPTTSPCSSLSSPSSACL